MNNQVIDEDQPIAPCPILSRISTFEYKPRRITVAQLKKSIQEELVRLLTTTNIRHNDSKKYQSLNILDYGIPSFTELDAHCPDNQEKLAQSIKRAINSFEPRLSDINIKVTANTFDQLGISINAVIKIGDFKEDFEFSHQIT